MANVNKSIHINTGAQRIPVDVDGQGGAYIEFNANDTLFVQRLHRFYKTIMEKVSEWEKIAPEIEARLREIETDEHGMPIEIEPALEPLYEMNTFMRDQIDLIFGKGTSKNIFGDLVTRDPSIYAQLIQGVQNYIQPVRIQKIEKYTGTGRKRHAKRK